MESNNTTLKCTNFAKNLHYCTCTYDCEKKGICCECVTYHRNKKEIPGCFFPLEVEADWDRSIENFIKNCK